MLKIGLIGYGYWGPNLARNFSGNPECELVRIADRDQDRRGRAQTAHPNVEVVQDDADITGATDIDVVVIATPVFTHFDLGKTALENGKHIWMEKPMCSTADQCKELVDLAESKGLTLMVDHTFLFTGVVQKMKSLVESGALGDLYYYDSVRINLGLFQHDVNVLWDLAPHDISIMDYILGPSALAIAAHGVSHFNTGLEDVAYLSVFYENNLMAHFHVNWMSPVKIRRTVLGGSKKMLLWDDMDPEEKLRIYDKGADITTREDTYGILADYRIGEMVAPVIPTVEALGSEVAYFIECIEKQERPHNDGEAGLRVVKILEATDRSLKADGKLIEL
jgi:predicted dehydrogenase